MLNSSRRDFLRLGALGLGGLGLADLLRLRAQAAPAARKPQKSVIMVYLSGGPSHIDMYDLKPEAPAEYRGDFKPIRTRVPGFDICECLPLQAQISDKLALIRGLETVETHDDSFLTTGIAVGNGAGSSGQNKWPTFGSFVSRVRERDFNGMPSYVSLDKAGDGRVTVANPLFLGAAHRPFTLSGPGFDNLTLAPGMTRERLSDRKTLLHSLDTLRRDLDDAMAGLDTFHAQALEIITSDRVRQAFDLTQEPDRVRSKYGMATKLLLARRLAEAGVSVVTASLITKDLMDKGWETTLPMGYFDWDAGHFAMPPFRRILPRYDQAIHALISDLHERGLDKDVAVVVWGEFGRTPRLNKSAGRDHWPAAGFALLAGGGLKTGQVLGATDARAERSKGIPFKPHNVLATLYHVLGIDPATTVSDQNGRPHYLLDDREPIQALL
jgi:hypothetical protein